MNYYYLVRFNMTPCMESETDILAALLGEKNFESFVPDAEGLSAYVKKELYDAAAVRDAVASYPFEGKIEFSEELIPGQDWNSEWEKNYFQPIVFENRCVVHSSFHHDYPSAEYDIVIDPRMAFGTGHHETTSMMIGRLLNNNLEGLSLLDMGTGTGILAILAAMRGAEKVVGVEIDPAAYENAVDNIKLNDTPEVELRLGGAETVTETGAFDFVMANINRNIILDDIAVYARAMKPKGRMFLSGFYVDDIDMIVNAARALGLCLTSVIANKNWANICFTRIEYMNFTE